MRVIPKASLDEVLRGMNIKDLASATIRQCVNTAQELERVSGEGFVHLEMGYAVEDVEQGLLVELQQ